MVRGKSYLLDREDTGVYLFLNLPSRGPSTDLIANKCKMLCYHFYDLYSVISNKGSLWGLWNMLIETWASSHYIASVSCRVELIDSASFFKLKQQLSI